MLILFHVATGSKQDVTADIMTPHISVIITQIKKVGLLEQLITELAAQISKSSEPVSNQCCAVLILQLLCKCK